jgi:lysozyme family protein
MSNYTSIKDFDIGEIKTSLFRIGEFNGYYKIAGIESTIFYSKQPF